APSSHIESDMTKDVDVYAGSSVTFVRMGDDFKASGDNSDGMLGDGTTTTSASTTPKGISGAATMLAIGSQPRAAILPTGAGKCWGNNENGQIGDGTHENRLEPTAVSTF